MFCGPLARKTVRPVVVLFLLLLAPATPEAAHQHPPPRPAWVGHYLVFTIIPQQYSDPGDRRPR
jgi:hypothetical protein